MTVLLIIWFFVIVILAREAIKPTKFGKIAFTLGILAVAIITLAVM